MQHYIQFLTGEDVEAVGGDSILHYDFNELLTEIHAQAARHALTHRAVGRKFVGYRFMYRGADGLHYRSFLKDVMFRPEEIGLVPS